MLSAYLRTHSVDWRNKNLKHDQSWTSAESGLDSRLGAMAKTFYAVIRASRLLEDHDYARSVNFSAPARSSLGPT
jgi:hypothetical protein